MSDTLPRPMMITSPEIHSYHREIRNRIENIDVYITHATLIQLINVLERGLNTYTGHSTTEGEALISWVNKVKSYYIGASEPEQKEKANG